MTDIKQDGNPRPRREQIVSPEMDNATATKLSYAYGIRTDNIVWIAGQVARDAAGNLIGEGDAEAQAEQCLTNMRAIIEAAGGTMDDIVRMVIYLTDRSYRPAVGTVRARIFHEPFLPTTTLVIVAGLALPEYLVEIEGVAVLTDD